jgi:hypothetical protein
MRGPLRGEFFKWLLMNTNALKASIGLLWPCLGPLSVTMLWRPNNSFLLVERGWKSRLLIKKVPNHIVLGFGFCLQVFQEQCKFWTPLKAHWRMSGQVLSAQIITPWSQKTQQILTWWWLRCLPLHFLPDLNKSSVVGIRICVFGRKSIASTPMAMSPNYLASYVCSIHI